MSDAAVANAARTSGRRLGGISGITRPAARCLFAGYSELEIDFGGWEQGEKLGRLQPGFGRGTPLLDFFGKFTPVASHTTCPPN